MGSYGKILEDNGTRFDAKIPRVQVRYSRPDHITTGGNLWENKGEYGDLWELPSLLKLFVALLTVNNTVIKTLFVSKIIY